MDHYTSLRFSRFKGFRQFSLSLQQFNILVGPNNCGKSTVLGAFRILAEGMRKANAKNPILVDGPQGQTFGYRIELGDIPVATENVFYDYDDSEPATVNFRLSSGNELTLFFTEVGVCNLICNTQTRPVRSTSQFREAFPAPIGFVPILGPVEDRENLYQKDAARLALLTHRAARNFRNIWYHYPEGFEEFRSLVTSTWPGMDINFPQVDLTHTPPRLHMFCPEERIPREIYWAGFGFQVWCQMLTYLIRGRNASIFLIDEPDIYLHSDLQRQLLGILRTLGPDVLIATHSTEIISEAEPDDLVVLNKRRKSAKRIRQPGELQAVFQALGSNLNPVLTQLAKTRRVLFVEGKDFQVLSRFARRLGYDRVANRGDFAVISSEGFNPVKIRDFISGIETTLGNKVLAGVVLDRDYRSDAESASVLEDLEKTCHFARIHERKEIENFLLNPRVLARAINSKIAQQEKRTNKRIAFNEDVTELLARVTEPMRHKVMARYLERRKPYERARAPGTADETITERLMEEYDKQWNDMACRLKLVPGKEAFGALNAYMQQDYGVTITPTAVIDAFQRDDIDYEMKSLIAVMDSFAKDHPQ